MQAVRIHEWGNIDVIKIEEVPTPEIKPDEVLISVHAAGVNPIDWKVREGYFSSFMKDCFPFPMGWDCSGTITAVGSQITKYKIGDEVIGLLRFPEPAGTFAEYVAAPQDHITLKPASLDHEHAAGVSLVGLTAWQILFETAKLQPQQTVLIHAAGGAVGQFAVQLAKIKGAKVIAVASEVSKTLLTSYGVDEFIDYKKQNFESLVKNVDVVIDGVGGDTTIRSLSVLKPQGKIIIISSPLTEEIENKAKTQNIGVIRTIVKPNGQQLQDIVHLIDDGLLSIKIEKIFPLSQIKEALTLQQTGSCHGKVIIKIK